MSVYIFDNWNLPEHSFVDLESKLEEHDQLIEAVFNPDESSSSSSGNSLFYV